MKTKSYLLFILLLSVSFGYSQCAVDAAEDMTITCGDSVKLNGDRTWYVGYNETSFQQNGVFFTTNLIGYTVGQSGTIRKTTDGGLNWQTQVSNKSETLNAVYFVNSDSGIVVGDNGTVLRTTDGGSNWTPVFVATETLTDVFFTGDNTGFVVSANGRIFKTTDNGVNWTQKGNVTKGLGCVHFPSANVGYALSGTTIFKTTNGGENWSALPPAVENVSQLFFVNETVGYMTGRGNLDPGTVYKTTDGGHSWTTLSINYGYGTEGIFFLNENEGYVGTVGKIFKTTDGGKKWISTHIGFMNISAIHFPSAKVGYALGYTMTQVKVTKYTEPDLVSWSPAMGLSSTTILNPVASPTVTTTYKVTTTTGTCIATDSIKITVAKLTVQASANSTIICGGSVLLSATTNYTGKGQLNYSWSPVTGLNSSNIANPVVSSVQTTTYTVTITTPNGCTATDSVKVFVDPFKIDAGINKSLICGGNVLLDNVTSNYTGNGILTYSWLPATSLDATNIVNPVASPVHTTKYILTVSTPNGCVATDSITVFVDSLKAYAGNDKPLICGGSVQLDNVNSNYTGGGTLSYSWTPGNGLNLSNIANPIVTVTKPSTFYIEITTPNGCVATDSVKVSVAALTVNAGADKLHICGDSVQLDSVLSNYTGNDTLTYSWLPTAGLNNTTITRPISTEAGITYTVTVNTSNGCQASDQVKVNLKVMDAIDICMVGVDSTEKNSVFWEATGNVVIDSVIVYKETSVTNNFIKIATVAYGSGKFLDNTSQPNVKSDKYKISILDTCGLESAVSGAHKTMHLAINKGIGTSLNLIWEPYQGFSVPTYKIYRGTSKTNLQFHDEVSGTTTQYTDYNPPSGVLYYLVEVVNPHPCVTANGVSARSNISVNNPVGIRELSDELTFTIYPNPANNLLTVRLENIIIEKNLKLTIYNAIGSVVKTITIQGNQQQMDVSELSNGFYMLELKSMNGRSIQKLVIEK